MPQGVCEDHKGANESIFFPQKLVDDWKYMRAHADEPLAKFLDYCTYGHMIDNVCLIVTGTLHERDVHELLDKCHPLGLFENIATGERRPTLHLVFSMQQRRSTISAPGTRNPDVRSGLKRAPGDLRAVAVASSMKELYRLVLVETPLAPYFGECLTSDDLDEMNIEIMRNTLYKAYLEDFYKVPPPFHFLSLSPSRRIPAPKPPLTHAHGNATSGFGTRHGDPVVRCRSSAKTSGA